MSLYDDLYDVVNFCDYRNMEKGDYISKTYKMNFISHTYIYTISVKLIDRDYEMHYLFSVTKLDADGNVKDNKWAIWDNRHCEWIYDWNKKKIVSEWRKMKSLKTKEQVERLYAWQKWKEKKKNEYIKERDKDKKYHTPDWVYEAWDRYQYRIQHGLR